MDLQFARLNYFVEKKRRILDHLLEQCCRQMVFLDLRGVDALMHEELSQLLNQSRDLFKNVVSRLNFLVA